MEKYYVIITIKNDIQKRKFPLQLLKVSGGVDLINPKFEFLLNKTGIILISIEKKLV